VLINDPVLLN